MDYITIILLGYVVNFGVFLIMSLIILFLIQINRMTEIAQFNLKVKSLESRMKFIKNNLPLRYRLKYNVALWPYSGILIFIYFMYYSIRKPALVVILDYSEKNLELLEKDFEEYKLKTNKNQE